MLYDNHILHILMVIKNKLITICVWFYNKIYLAEKLRLKFKIKIPCSFSITQPWNVSVISLYLLKLCLIEASTLLWQKHPIRINKNILNQCRVFKRWWNTILSQWFNCNTKACDKVSTWFIIATHFFSDWDPFTSLSDMHETR